VIDALAGDDCVDLDSGADRGKGGPGRDLVVGGAGPDRISGSSGNDRLRGNDGKDRLSGGRGKDRILAADKKRDRIRCGAGRDRVVADRTDRVARDCERVRRVGMRKKASRSASSSRGSVPAMLEAAAAF